MVRNGPPPDLRRRGRDVALALLSAVLLAASMPGEVSGLLAWVSLAPLVIAIAGRSPLSAAGFGYLAGVVSSVLTYRWVFSVPGFGPQHALLLAGWLGVFPALWCAALGLLSRRRAPIVAVAPLLWVLLEWIRGHAGFLAFPWGSLAQTQHADLSLLQLAAVAGEPGLSFLVAAVGVALGRIIAVRAWREAAVVGLLVVAAHVAGVSALASALPGPSPRVRVAIVQPSILAAERKTEEGYRAMLERLERLTREVATRPALVVWPETAVRGLSVDDELRGRLARLAGEVGASILTGSSTTEKFVDAAAATRFTAVICWENLFTGYVRRAVADGAGLLVVLTNDAWAGRSAAPLQHNAAAVLRAVETGVPVVVASNAGPSVVIDRHGRVIASARGVFTAESVTAAVTPGAATTLYARLGDPLAAAAVLAAAALLAVAAPRTATLKCPGAGDPVSRRA